MGLFGGKKRAISHEGTRLHALQIQTSSYGQPFVIQFGTGRLSGKMLWNGDFIAVAHTSSETTGGKGGGGGTTTTTTTYTYTTAADLFLCIGRAKGLLSVWDTKGKRKTLGRTLFNSTVPASPAYTRQPVGTGFLMDLGCGLVANRNVNANDYGDDGFGIGGRVISIVGEVTPMPRVVGAPAAGQYSVDEVTGIYTFNAADASKAIQIQYVAVNGAQSPAAQYGFGFFDGSQVAAWGYMTTKHPGQDLVYKLFTRVFNSVVDCGESGQLPNFSWEVVGLLLYPGQLDAHAHDIISYVLTDSIMGIGFPLANIDANTQFKNYVTANGLFLSPTLDTQEEVRTLLNELLLLTNSEAFMSEGLLKIRSYGDQTVIGNGATYTPDTTPIYDLGLDDFIAADGEPPIVWSRSSKTDAFNSISLEYRNRANEYNLEVIEERDSAEVETYGLRKQDPIQAHPVTQKTVAAMIANTLVKKSVRNLGTGKFVVGVQYCGLEPMNLVTITVPKLGFTKKPVRILRITENDDRTFEMEVEEFPYASASPTLYPKGEGSGFSPNTNNDPGSIATPFIYEPPSRATQDGLGNEVWVGAYGASPDWGGADVWLSNDNITYRKITTPIPGKMRSGITSGTLVAAADPDTTHTIDVDLSGSGGTLVNASATDCDSFRSLVLIGSELMSFQDVTLLGTNLYRLGTRLRRGVYGTPLTSHAVSESVVRIDDNILKIKFKAEDVGQTFYMKFASYNTFGRAEQDISTLSPYSFVLGGANGGNDFVPTELVHDALVLQATATGAGTLLVKIATTAYTIVSKDTLEYDVWIDPDSVDFKAGVDIIFGDATTIMGNGYRDQVPLSADPSTDLSSYAKAQWFHRKIDLSRAAGKVTASWLIGFDASSVGFHRAKFANVRIMNGRTVKATGWVTGVPAFSLITTNTNYTVGVTPLYSQNDGGQWFGLLVQGSSAGLNQQGSTIPFSVTNTPFTYGTGGTGLPYIKWTWGTITVYRPDATTFSIPSSASMYNMVPPTPTLSQVAGGAKGAATQRVRIAYMKGDLIMAVGAEASLAVSANNVLKITSPAAVAGFDGWMPLVGSTAGIVYPQSAVFSGIHFGTDFTEPTAGARFLTTLGAAATEYFAAATAGNTFNGCILALKDVTTGLALAFSTTYRFYPTYYSLQNMVYMPGGCFTGSFGINQGALQVMFSDNYTPLGSGTGMTGITASSGGSGGGGGGGCPKVGHRIFAEHGLVYGTPYKNSKWSLVRTEGGGIFQVVPRHRWTTLRGLVRSQDLIPGEDFLRVIVRATKEKKWARVISQERLTEETEAESVHVAQDNKLYFCGAPDSTCDAEGHNLKPL